MELMIFKISASLLALLNFLAALGLLLHIKNAHFIFATAWFLNVFFIVFKWVLADAPPLGTIYHLLSFVAITFYPLYLILRRHVRFSPLFAVLAFSASLPLIGMLFMTPPVEWKRMPILQSHWFIPHVLAYSIAYALALGAFILNLSGEFQLIFKRDANSFFKSTYMLSILAFAFLTFGLVSGSLWASQSWGTFWAWDPKETWGLITFCAYAIYFHSLRHQAFKPYAHYWQNIAFVALVCTCFVVAFTPLGDMSKHAYGS